VVIVTLSAAEGSLPGCEEILRFAALSQDDRHLAVIHPFGAPFASKLGCKPSLSNGGSFQTNPPDK
jgi:hypothetical protein